MRDKAHVAAQEKPSRMYSSSVFVKVTTLKINPHLRITLMLDIHTKYTEYLAFEGL